MNEAQIRHDLIDPTLDEAGWNRPQARTFVGPLAESVGAKKGLLVLPAVRCRCKSEKLANG